MAEKREDAIQALDRMGDADEDIFSTLRAGCNGPDGRGGRGEEAGEMRNAVERNNGCCPL